MVVVHIACKDGMMIHGTPYWSARRVYANGMRGSQIAIREIQIGEKELTPESLAPIMLQSADHWNRVSVFVSTVMQKKLEIIGAGRSSEKAAPQQPDTAVGRGEE